MQPPWKKYPEIKPGSIGWRMGAGEAYYDSFYCWFSQLATAEQLSFEETNPEPRGWNEFYSRIKSHPWSG